MKLAWKRKKNLCVKVYKEKSFKGLLIKKVRFSFSFFVVVYTEGFTGFLSSI